MTNGKWNVYLRAMSLVAIALGVTLAAFKVTVDSEPGAVPLLLLATGTVGVVLTRRRPGA